MKFLVDECVAWPLVEALRRRFEDVVYVREVSPAAPDVDVLEWAVRESRTLVTEDYDFGELVFYRQLNAEAVVIIAPGVLGVDLLADADAVVHYIEEWATEADMRRRVQSDRFTSLLAVMESSKDPPEVKFDFVTTTRGLDYVAEVRGRAEEPTEADVPPAKSVTRPGERT